MVYVGIFLDINSLHRLGNICHSVKIVFVIQTSIRHLALVAYRFFGTQYDRIGWRFCLFGIAHRFGNACNFQICVQKSFFVTVAFETIFYDSAIICYPVLFVFTLSKTMLNINKNLC